MLASRSPSSMRVSCGMEETFIFLIICGCACRAPSHASPYPPHVKNVREDSLSPRQTFCLVRKPPSVLSPECPPCSRLLMNRILSARKAVGLQMRGKCVGRHFSSLSRCAYALNIPMQIWFLVWMSTP
jgi:hypothetical protein